MMDQFVQVYVGGEGRAQKGADWATVDEVVIVANNLAV